MIRNCQLISNHPNVILAWPHLECPSEVKGLRFVHVTASDSSYVCYEPQSRRRTQWKKNEICAATSARFVINSEHKLIITWKKISLDCWNMIGTRSITFGKERSIKPNFFFSNRLSAQHWRYQYCFPPWTINSSSFCYLSKRIMFFPLYFVKE